MNAHVKYLLLCIVFGVIAWFSTTLWDMAPYGSPILVFVSAGLGIVTLALFVKIFTPEKHFLELLGDFITGLIQYY
jgi:hypothetical protein